MNRSEILQKADNLITGDRQEQYGDALPAFTFTSNVLMNYMMLVEKTGRFITPQDTAALQIILKLSRIAVAPEHKDSWVDIAGYAALGGELALEEKENE